MAISNTPGAVFEVRLRNTTRLRQHGALLKVQRGFEMEADLLAVQVTAKAGYDPGALVRYMGRVQPEDTGRSRALFALPLRDTRWARRIVVE